MLWEMAIDPWQDILARPWGKIFLFSQKILTTQLSAPFQYDCAASIEEFHLRFFSKHRLLFSQLNRTKLSGHIVQNQKLQFCPNSSKIYMENLNGNVLFSNVYELTYKMFITMLVSVRETFLTKTLQSYGHFPYGLFSPHFKGEELRNLSIATLPCR
jgi:hypothetical protein